MSSTDTSGTYASYSSIFWKTSGLKFLQVNTLTTVHTGFPFPTFRTAFLVICLLTLVILTGVNWNFKVILPCNSLKVKDVEHFYKCSLIIFISWSETSHTSFLNWCAGGP